MENIGGVRIGLRLGGEDPSFDAEGYVGSCKDLFSAARSDDNGIVDTALVEIRTSRRDIAVLSGGKPQEGLAIKRDLSRDAPENPGVLRSWASRFVFGAPEEGERVYQWRVPILRGGRGFYAKPHQNFVRVLEIFEEGGFSLWEVALVVQDGDDLFVTQQLVYEERCFNDEGVVVCPRFERERQWPGLVEILHAVFEDRVGDLPPVSEYEPEQVAADDLCEGEGIVLFYSLAKQYGAVRLRDGSALVRSAALEPRPEGGKLRILFKGERVSCDGIVEADPDSPFDFEVGVVLISE